MSKHAPTYPFHRFFTLPELVGSLGPHLDPPNLYSCIRVCRLWNTALIPHLWRAIDDGKYAWPRILVLRDGDKAQGHQDDEWLHQMFVKYGKYVRSMDVHWSAMFSPANSSGTCNNLRSLIVHDLGNGETFKDMEESDRLAYLRPENVYHRLGVKGHLLSPLLEGVIEPALATWRTTSQQQRDWLAYQHLWLLIRQNPKLHSLTLHYSISRLSQIMTADFFHETLSLLPNLVELQCDGVLKGISGILEALPRLQRLTTCSGFTDNAVPRKAFEQLRVLDARVDFASKDFFLLLKRLPNLEYLHCVGFQEEEELDFADAGLILEHQPRNLKQLLFGTGNQIKDEQLATQLIPWLPKLTEFVNVRLMPMTAEALRTYCRDLECVGQLRRKYDFYLVRGVRPTVNEVSLLLRECPRLQFLDNIRVQIDIDMLLLFPWASTSLERLTIQVSGVTRLTEAEQIVLKQLEQEGPSQNGVGLKLSKEENRVLAKISDSREQQRRVYDRLGGLKNLRLLDFGYDYARLSNMATNQYLGHYGGSFHESARRFAGPIENVLELSLASGLDRLAGLKDLEMFGFDGADHCIGKAELMWMANHWPKLTTIRGLQVEDFDDPPRKCRKMYLTTLMRSLRPDIVIAGRL
ncbi:hypothetical protein BGZ96_004222 [Linnemannia gamsii]|uniref:F-box domain-containing protein n=1 Tax=Linnemannia gamsii TaxID=64522 RepID=A0ABQ7KGM1_9FUNG|nr:hypothetical protein BGZ96_004222 [Linnemannia gamsii]